MSKELIRLSNCTMAFDSDVVLDNINLYINDQEFLTLLGPVGAARRPRFVLSVVFRRLPRGTYFLTA